jgi:hypothetical protein
MNMLAKLPLLPLAAGELPFHPLAEIFPLIEGAEFDALVADIKAHGQRYPIVLCDGKILDGRNRYRACIELGREPKAEVYAGHDPVAYVISTNLTRRHLSTSQRAMIAAQLATLKNGQRSDLVQAPSIEGAAALLNVGHASVERAKFVRERGDEDLIRAVQSGDVTVSGAVERINRGIVTGVAMHCHAERGLDLYETPAPAVRALLGVERFDGPIWEPACGPGAIVRELRDTGHKVIASDIAEYGCEDAAAGVDFLALARAPEGVRTILTNPPFMFANEFVRHGLSLVPRVVMLLRLAFLEGESRRDILDNGNLARVYVFRNRVPFHRHGWDGPQAAGNAIAFAWFAWDRDHCGPALVERISWEAV